MSRLWIRETPSGPSDGDRYWIETGDCRDLLARVKDEAVQLVMTSPPYNLGKDYEERIGIEDYLGQQREVIEQCVRVLAPDGSLCWQVGNFVHDGEIIPLDAMLYPIFKQLGLRLRNRIVWTFEHGLHCRRRFSGRYETILWFTKCDNYFFDVDPIRVPQKYPSKRHFKGPRIGELSCNPLGKNPGDVWQIPNVKSNHIEKTEHPCQFPVELVERLVLSMTRPGQVVLDPFLGVGSTVVAAVRHKRIGLGAELSPRYASIARRRVREEVMGTLRTRPMGRPIHDPDQVSRTRAVVRATRQQQSSLEKG